MRTNCQLKYCKYGAITVTYCCLRQFKIEYSYLYYLSNMQLKILWNMQANKISMHFYIYLLQLRTTKGLSVLIVCGGGRVARELPRRQGGQGATTAAGWRELRQRQGGQGVATAEGGGCCDGGRGAKAATAAGWRELRRRQGGGSCDGGRVAGAATAAGWRELRRRQGGGCCDGGRGAGAATAAEWRE